ncbi:MAG: NAD(P)/FAD-dependent oxidoreductase [Candidatus Aminicenantes bacterium]|nr:NAD(P)/FAD-dependent oxidoreductase [Candidatus Aminicenantes bacterium]
MTPNRLDRRDFLKTVLAGIPLAGRDWTAFPRGRGPQAGGAYDAIVIGAGLGGLSCGAAFARQGFKVLVLEKHSKPGGYATTFKRPGGFVFDASLHSTTVGERDGVHNLIPGFPEIKDVAFAPHPNIYRAIYPDDDIRVPARDVPGYIKLLTDRFPEEKEGIQALFDDMTGIAGDINALSAASAPPPFSEYPKLFPHLMKAFGKPWSTLVDVRVKNPKLKGLVSSLWGYYGLPPSKLSSFYYALPTIGYLTQGGYYPHGKSQAISNALAKFIADRGGTVQLSSPVESILVRDKAAEGVKTVDGREYRARVVVSNANAYDLFHKMVPPAERPADYLARMDKMTPSLSTFQVFLGLKKNLIKETGIKDTEIFKNSGYDIESDYAACVRGDVANGFGLTLYDNLFPDYSPAGKNTLSIMTLQGYDPWLKYEADYFAGRKDAYRAEKNRLADIMIEAVERTLLPGLRGAVEVKEIATPLTNVRYTGNYRGAIYGWDQTVGNSGPQRMAPKTPIKNLYLAGAWTSPGGGYAAVVPSGLQCFAEIMKTW